MHGTIRLHPSKLRRSQPTKERLTVGEYLLKKMIKEGVSHLFGSDRSHDNLSFFHLLSFIQENPRISLINVPLSIEAEAASGYGLAQKLGVLLATEASCEIHLASILQASRDQIPLLVILGSTHKSMPQGKAFREFSKFLDSCFFAQTTITETRDAAKQIDRLVDTCMHMQKPCLLRLPNEIANAFIPTHVPRQTQFRKSDPESLRDALISIKKVLHTSKQPICYLGRGALTPSRRKDTLLFLEKNSIPFLLHPLARGLIDENHPLLLAHHTESDVALFLGITPSRYEQETNYFKVATKNKIFAMEQESIINKERYKDLFLHDFLHHLTYQKAHKHFQTQQHKIISCTHSWLFQSLSHLLPDTCVLVSELIPDSSSHFAPDSLFPSCCSNIEASACMRAIGIQYATKKRMVILLNHTTHPSYLATASHHFLIPPIFIIMGDKPCLNTSATSFKMQFLTASKTHHEAMVIYVS